MQYLLRVFVAIVTFAVGSGIAGFISPVARKPYLRSHHQCDPLSAAKLRFDSGAIDPRWVYFPRNLQWNESAPHTESEALGEAPVTTESAFGEVAIFYPSGQFVFVEGELERPKGVRDQFYLFSRSDLGFRIYVGNWVRNPSGSIDVIAKITYMRSALFSARFEKKSMLRQKWFANGGELQAEQEVALDRKTFVHRAGFSSLDLISRLSARGASAPTILPLVETAFSHDGLVNNDE